MNKKYINEIIEKGYKEKLTQEEAIILCDVEILKKWNPIMIVGFQLYQARLCMNFGDFQRAVQIVLGRPVWTHEFAYPENIKKEFEGKKGRPTMEEIINLIPKEKILIIKT